MVAAIHSAATSLLQQLLQLKAETVTPPAVPNPTEMPSVTATVSPIGDQSGFSALISKGLGMVSQAQSIAHTDEMQFASGAPNAPSLAETMLAMQKGDISFQELIAIRNELATGYNTLINMPV
ncbi:MAG: flagellar hook-basal body complex protein FliE [Acidithiobacillus sp.]|nr:flagellar hook-basal body complex protein FliE [Acidithiobacillus sp.]